MRASILVVFFAWLLLSTACPGLAQESMVKVGNSVISEEAAKFVERGTQLSSKQDYEGAVKAFREAVKLAPEAPELHVNLASVLYRTGKFAETVSECNKAINVNPKDPFVWSIAGPAYQMLGQLEQAIGAYKRCVELSPPQSADHKRYLEAVHGMESELKSRQSLPPGNPNNYLAEVTWDGVHCWAKDKMPLKVFLADGKSLAGFRPEFDQVMRNSFGEWAAASNGKVAFTFVPSKQNSDIACTWSNDRSKFVQSGEAGQSIQTTCADGVLHADIVIACKTPDGQSITTEGMHGTCLHEIGHAIGLHGHSRQADDIMFNSDVLFRTTTATLTKRDAATIQALYELKFLERKQK